MNHRVQQLRFRSRLQASCSQHLWFGSPSLYIRIVERDAGSEHTPAVVLAGEGDGALDRAKPRLCLRTCITGSAAIHVAAAERGILGQIEIQIVLHVDISAYLP